MQSKILIIGGGVAGLSTGIYGQLNGYDTEILEMHSQPGGQCTAWRRKDYTFDYCIHWLVGSSHGPFHEVWKETGALNGKTRMWDPDRFVTMRLEDGSDFIIYSGVDRWEEYLLGLAPEDSRPIKLMCGHMRRMSRMEMFSKAYFDRNLFDYLRMVRRSAPALRLFFKYGKTSLEDYFKKLGFRSPLLEKSLMTMAGAMGDFSAIGFLMALTWFSQNNAGYPIGGSMPFTMRMAERYRELGGTFSGRSRVEKIMVHNGRAVGVRLSNGSVKYADYVVGACDLHALMYDMLDGKYLNPKIERAFDSWPLFPPIVQVSFGIDRQVNCNSHNLQVYAPGSSIGSTALKAGYTISNYNHDPEITPAGKCVMKLIFDSPFEIWDDMGDDEYREEKLEIHRKACILLEEAYPEVKGHIEVVDVATPLTGVRYTGVWKGSYEGFLPSSSNMTKILKYDVPGLHNLYLAGQWLQPGGGLPPSAQSGKWVIKLITKKDRKKFRVS